METNFVIRQISVFLENRPGSLAEVTRYLADQRVNLRAMSIADSRDFGTIRIIASDQDACAEALRKQGYQYNEVDVLAAEMPDRPGGIAEVAEIIAQENINIEYGYAMVEKKEDSAVIVLRVDDPYRASIVLRGKGVRLLSEREVKAVVKHDQEDGQRASVLVINPGSTSTETGLFDVSGKGRVRMLDHREDALEAFEHVLDQLDWREKEIARFIENEGFETAELQAVVGRGGLLRPLAGGTYQVTDAMCADLEQSRYGEHASNLGALLARRFSTRYNVPSYVVDPVTTDEFDPASRLSGVPGIERKCRNHALSIKAAARRAAERLGKDLQETRLVAAHLGGGISICALRGGRIVDSTDALLGEGPFSPERAGTVPLAGMLCTLPRRREDRGRDRQAAFHGKRIERVSGNGPPP